MKSSSRTCRRLTHPPSRNWCRLATNRFPVRKCGTRRIPSQPTQKHLRWRRLNLPRMFIPQIAVGVDKIYIFPQTGTNSNRLTSPVTWMKTGIQAHLCEPGGDDETRSRERYSSERSNMTLRPTAISSPGARTSCWPPIHTPAHALCRWTPEGPSGSDGPHEGHDWCGLTSLRRCNTSSSHARAPAPSPSPRPNSSSNSMRSACRTRARFPPR